MNEAVFGVSRKTESPLKNNRMKRYCKAIDITDRGLISTAVYKCLNKKYKRNDTLRLFSTYTILDVNQIYYILRRYGKKALWFLTEAVIDDIRKEIVSWDIKFPPVWYREKIDASSGKIRRIGIQNIKQQIYDYIAVEALQPILKRIGEHQYASIKGRGTLKGARAIRRWLRNRKLTYVAQSDVKKCYESIDREKLMQFLEHYVKNDLLLKLIRKLIYSFEKGLSIGSYLSQFLCNLYMSILYHEVSENMYRIRKHRNAIKERINLVKKKVFYMDDVLLTGTNKKDIKKAMKLFIRKAKELGLTIKPTFRIYRIAGTFVDMMGYRIYQYKTTIRRRVFRRVRKSYVKVRKLYGTHKPIPVKWAKRCSSYYGYLKNTDSKHIRKRWKVKKMLRICKGVIKREESKIYTETAIT